MTNLIPQTADLEVHDDDNLESLLTRVASRKVVAEPEVPHKTPKVVAVPPRQKAALKHLARDLDGFELPSERRTLTEAEQRSMVLMTHDAKAAAKAVSAATAAIKTAVFNHFDVTLESDNDIEDLPYDEASGHYLVDCELLVEGTGLKFTRELRQGSPDLTHEHLLALYEDGKLTRDEYLKATRQVRVVDEDGVMKVIRNRPDILADIEEVIEPGKVTASFWVREVPKEQDAG
jgi:hypothetical protein